MRRSFAALAGLLMLGATIPVSGQEVPNEIGQCVETTIEKVGSRLVGVSESGDAVMYSNGIFGVSYDAVPGLRRSKPGDPVQLCLTSLPEDCPPGDERGKIYTATNLKNNIPHVIESS